MLLCLRPRECYITISGCRRASSWAQDVSKPNNLIQSYTSTINDPFLNLSIEHYLLQKAPPKSVILFFYINRPCVVIGRNQNPWLEVNLKALWNESNALGKVDLVRRRSGGGTVFHDEGNVNWTVISPSESFTRDKHAEMIVRALRRQGVDRARVNKRHDIVLDQGKQRVPHEANDLHKSPFTSEDPSLRPLKVSGSAYKLTRGRALHHGTCLLISPNLGKLSNLLRSPARPYIKAKGVESVSSPVSNIGLDVDIFKLEVVKEFSMMYGAASGSPLEVSSNALEVEEIAKGNEELHTPEWLWDQTPGFSLSSTPLGGTAELDLSQGSTLPPKVEVSMEFKQGRIIEASISTSRNFAEVQSSRFRKVVAQRRLRDPWSWERMVRDSELEIDSSGEQQIARWLQRMIPRPGSSG